MTLLPKTLDLGLLGLAVLLLGFRSDDIMQPTLSGSTARSLTLRDSAGEVNVSAQAPFVDHLEPLESRRYDLPLNEGQYVHLVVEQRGVDVALRLLDDRDQKLIEVDSPTGVTGDEVLHVVGDGRRTLTLEIVALDRGAGTYELRVDDLRDATAIDRTRVAAQDAFFRAKELAESGSADVLPQALEGYEEALEFARRVPDFKLMASSSYNSARIHQRRGEYPAALDRFQQAREAFEELGESWWTAVVLNRIGMVHYRMRDLKEALNSYSRALDVSRKLGDRPGEASSLNNIGNVHRSTGEFEQALQVYRQALELWIEEDLATDQATVLSSIGECLTYLDQIPEAQDALHEALSLSRSSGAEGLEALILNGLARAHYRQGEPQRSLKYLERALEISRRRKSAWAISLSLLRLGNVYLRLDRPEEGRGRFQEALELFRKQEDELGQAMAIANLARIEAAAGRYDQSLPLFDRALDVFRTAADHSSEASTLYASAKALRDCDQLEHARHRARGAIESVELLRSESKSLELRSSYFASRQNYYDLYIDILMDLSQREPDAHHELRALEASERRRARGLLDSLAEAANKIQLGADPALLAEKERLQRELNRIDNERIQLERSGFDSQEVESARKHERQLLTQYAELQGRIRRSSPRYASLIHPEPLTAEAIRDQVPDETSMLLVYEFGEERCFLWSITSEGIESFILPDRSRIEALVRKVYAAWRKRTSWNDGLAARYAREISDRLLAPVAKHLSRRRLIVVGEGIFSFIPFSALPDPRSDLDERLVPLIEHHEIQRLPSASVLATLRLETSGRTPPQGLVAVLADPVFSRNDPRVKAVGSNPGDNSEFSAASTPSPLERSAEDLGISDFERLQHSRIEAANIMALVPPEKGFQALDFEASRHTALSGRLRNYRMIHVATHGFLNTEHAELSGIVLSRVSERGEPVNGFLRVHEIYDMDLAADLVTLSACKTGLGEQIRGEGLVGLVQAFLYAGSSRVIVSLWNVSDRATAELMSRLYRGMLDRGLGPAAALREAQLSMLHDEFWGSPADWAGFIVYGDWG